MGRWFAKGQAHKGWYEGTFRSLDPEVLGALMGWLGYFDKEKKDE